MNNAILVKTEHGLVPMYDHDREKFNALKIGQAYRMDLKQMKPRSVQHHRLYWGGLIKLAMDYWQPKGGLICKQEKVTLYNVIKFYESQGLDSKPLRELFNAYLSDEVSKRSREIEAIHKDEGELHEWIKQEAGYFSWYDTPTGLVKKTKSINFNAMGQDEFNVFYKRAFNVVWNMILSKTFNSEQEAHNAINQLQALGG